MTFRLSSIYRRDQIDGRASRRFSRVTVIGRQAKRGTVYIVRDPSHSVSIGHALHNGCRIFVGSGPKPEILQAQRRVTWVSVPDATQALFELAALFRERSRATRIIVTGSSGKTNTKDMITHLLRQRYHRTAKTPGNWNGFHSVPIVMTRLNPKAPYWVIEIGMAYERADSIRPRAEVAKPQVAVVTTVGMSHLAYLGSVEAIAAEKAEAVKALLPGGLAVLNGDNKHCRKMASLTKGPVLFFGLKRRNDVTATNIRQTLRGLRFRLHYQKQRADCFLPLIGTYHVYNALAATAVALWAGFSLRKIARRFGSYRPQRQHGLVHRVGRTWVVDDGYNSNPVSVNGVLETLDSIKGNRKWLVLGDMQNLGPHTEKYSLELAEHLQQTDLAGVVFLGNRIRPVFDALPASDRYIWAENEGDAVRILLARLRGRSLVWLKSNEYTLFKRFRRLLLESLDARPKRRSRKSRTM